MKSKDFINEHIKIDDRTRISKKINTLSQKHKMFSTYLDMVQKEAYGIILHILLKSKYVHYTQLNNEINYPKYRQIINYLVCYDFIEESFDNNFTQEINVPRKPNVYSLTKKGKDFINIDYIKEYLETEYEVEEG